MKLQLTINGKSTSADFSQQAENVVLTLAAKAYEVQLVEPEPGLFTILINGKVFVCALEKQPNGTTEVIVNGQRIPVAMHDPKRLNRSGSTDAQAGGRATLTSPMPGKVVRILLTVGVEVAEGQSLLIVEAMKMQNEVVAPKAGKLVALNVTEGQTVNAGETLAVIE